VRTRRRSAPEAATRSPIFPMNLAGLQQSRSCESHDGITPSHGDDKARPQRNVTGLDLLDVGNQVWAKQASNPTARKYSAREQTHRSPTPSNDMAHPLPLSIRHSALASRYLETTLGGRTAVDDAEMTWPRLSRRPARQPGHLQAASSDHRFRRTRVLGYSISARTSAMTSSVAVSMSYASGQVVTSGRMSSRYAERFAFSRRLSSARRLV